MSAGHTPPPWEADGDDDVFTVDGDVVASCYGRDRREGNANARLIAAAPDLLSELRRLYCAYVRVLESARDRIIDLGGDCDPVDRMEERDPALCSARATIARAKGAA